MLTPRFEQRAAESGTFFAETTPAGWRGAGTGFGPRWRFARFEVWERSTRGPKASGRLAAAAARPRQEGPMLVSLPWLAPALWLGGVAGVLLASGRRPPAGAEGVA